MKLPLDFKKLITARFFFTFAVQMQAVILGWRIYALLKDPLSLGLIGLTEAVPAIGLALLAGYIIDRSRPLKVYRRVIFISLLSGLIVLSEHVFADHLTLTTQVVLLYFAAFLTGTARAFSQPSIFSAVPRLLHREQLVRGNAFSTSAMQTARMAGPAFGGFVFGFFGVITASSLVCVFLVCGIIAMTLIRTQIPPPNPTHRHPNVRDEFLSGLRFVFKHRILLPAMSLDMISCLFGGVTALLPIFASEILNAGPKGLGLLRAAPALGAMFASLYFTTARKSLNRNSGHKLFLAISGYGICIFVFGFSREFWISFAALAASGAFDSANMLIRTAAVQFSSPDDMRGKISAVNSIFIGSSNEIGEVESGIAAKLMGTIPSVYFGAAMCLATVATVAWFSPELRKMDLEKLS